MFTPGCHLLVTTGDLLIQPDQNDGLTLRSLQCLHVLGESRLAKPISLQATEEKRGAWEEAAEAAEAAEVSLLEWCRMELACSAEAGQRAPADRWSQLAVGGRRGEAPWLGGWPSG